MNYWNLRPTVFAVLCLVGASNVGALVVEPPSNSAVLGSPIEFNLRTTMAPGEEASGLCIEADVLQADALVQPSKVRVQLLGDGATRPAFIRISSAVVVEEPVLSLVVRSGCIQKSVRKFVVFADPPNFNSPPGTTLGAQASGARNSAVNRPKDADSLNLSGRADSSNLSGTSATPTIRQKERSVSRPVDVGRRSSAASSLKPSKQLLQSQRLGFEAAPASASRLQLDSVAEIKDTAPRLRTSPELTTLPTENASQRAEAAALWRVLGSSPDDLQRDLQQLKALQTETLALAGASAKSQAEKLQSAAQLKLAEDQRYNNPLVYGLATLLALALLALWRSRTSANSVSTVWWKPMQGKIEDAGAGLEEVVGKPAFRQPPSFRDSAVTSAAKIAASSTGRKEHEVAPKAANPRANESVFGTLAYQANPRDVNVEELFDIQQQADFFISLGQHDQAIDVLNNHISENAQTSPLVYLDLLSLYHSQDRAVDYSKLAAEFTRLFNGVVPAFDAFDEKTHGLEAYTSLLDLIESLWNTSAVIGVIEDSVFRSDSAAVETLDLEAYRELLLLHSIAKDLATSEVSDNSGGGVNAAGQKFDGSMNTASAPGSTEAATGSSGFNPTVLNVPLPKAMTSEVDPLDAEHRTSFFQKPIGARIGLDIDLSSDIPEASSSVATNPNKQTEVTNIHEEPAAHNTGFIEFDLDAFDAEVSKIKLKGRP